MEETVLEEPICEEAVLAEEIPEVKPAAMVNKNGVKAEAATASGGGDVASGGVASGGGGAASGFSGTKIFTWFMVLALLGVWSSVAVVWLDLVDYDNVIARAKEFPLNFSEVLQGKLSAYDADGDGDFDVEDAKVLLGLTKEGGEITNENADSLEEIFGILAEEGSDWFHGFFTFLYDVISPPVEKVEDPESETAEEEGDADEKEVKTAAPKKETLKKAENIVEVPVPKTEKTKDQSPGEVASKKNRTKGVKERPVSLVQKEAKEESAVEEQTEPIVEEVIQTTEGTEEEGQLPPNPSQEQQAPEGESPDAVGTTAKAEDATEESFEGKLAVEAGSFEAEAAVQVEEKEPVAVEEKTTQEDSEGNAEDQPEDMLQYKAKKKKPKLLNAFEKTIKAEIDAAEKLRKKGKVEEAVRAFDTLVQQYPQSPRCRYGKALAEDDLAEKMRSNDMLQKALSTYKEASELPNAMPDLIKATLKKRAERQQFLGRMRGALATLEKLVQIFSEDVALKNDLGVAHLLIGDNKSAKRVYEEVLAIAPSNGFAKVHYGFILKSENKIAESIPFLRDGLESGDPGTDDGRFYFHLGDALQRMGDDSAYKWYERGHQRGHFASVWQRSLYNVDGLKAQPWWTPKDTGYMDLIKTLERNWRTIRDEALSVMDKTTGLFVPEEENLREKGEWGQFTLWQQGKKAGESCHSVPKTCGLLERYTEATGCKRGQIKFSVMQPGTHVWPHTGPTNCRLRMHLGLVIPKTGCKIRCTNDTRAWEEGKVLIFDDSFEHEVWQDADSYRLIFIVDVWHPELTQYQRQTLSPI
ncbi:aspartyl/asparaginyl beta-hydroxylase isoform X35 [Oncorhynchus mykiss]|uniref:aspartyl/asparaginyl beta-hydroxylase isoform X35 n=1 Tax=Oncorhynchus mykiss TaxID=8022 RepID=UPI0018779ADC|nr:aspartyl/asparaginyl beta-hydroxylase isoform X35 [Oncorhynchus mykiss]